MFPARYARKTKAMKIARPVLCRASAIGTSSTKHNTPAINTAMIRESGNTACRRLFLAAEEQVPEPRELFVVAKAKFDAPAALGVYDGDVRSELLPKPGLERALVG